MFDTATTDRISFAILDCLHEAFADCRSLLAQSGASEYLNLAALFFHEVLRWCCEFYFKAYELSAIDAEYGHGAAIIYAPRPRPGRIGYGFVLGQRVPPEPPNLRAALRRLRDDAAWRVHGTRGSPRGPLALCARLLADELPAIEDGFGKWARASWSFRLAAPRAPAIVVPRAEEQTRLLLGSLSSLPARLAPHWPGAAATPDRLLALIEQRVRARLGRRNAELRADVLIVGTLTDLDSRILAALAKSRGIPVVALGHGEMSGTHDEPYAGYGEVTFADATVDYGDFGEGLVTEGRFSRPLFEEPVRHIATSSEIAARLFTGGPIRRLPSEGQSTLVYVPTSFSSDERYGPFRDLHDVAYWSWQDHLLRALADAGFRLILKRHPKQKAITPDYPPGVTVLTEGSVVDAAALADGFVFDYVTSAFTIVAATEKPLLYFDIGLRNLLPRAAAAVRDRSIYVRADPRQADAAVAEARRGLAKQCRNTYTPSFSLTATGRSRYQGLAVIVEELVHHSARRGAS